MLLQAKYYQYKWVAEVEMETCLQILNIQVVLFGVQEVGREEVRAEEHTMAEAEAATVVFFLLQ
jgi:hypothetical protein